MNELRLNNLLPENSPAAVLAEVEQILSLISPQFDPASVRHAFSRTIDLYTGAYPGYRACSTEYHDLAHTVETFLALARLCHGGVKLGSDFSERQICVGLIAALLHDSGYILEENDLQGTGAKYTVTHVERGMEFVAQNGRDFGLSSDEINTVRAMFLYTDLNVAIDSISGLDRWSFHLGELLGVADVFSQMSDRLYLEKLLFLFYEFQEGRVGDYHDEVDLLRQTVGFYDLMEQRFAKIKEQVDQYLLAHFAERWDVDTNFYAVAAARNKAFLAEILSRPGDPRINLKRNRIVDRIRLRHTEPD